MGPVKNPGHRLDVREDVRTDAASARKEKNEAVIRLLDEWLADESGYDEQTWPALKAGIEENRLSSRRRFRA
jgi:hypothetical protein